MRRPNNASKSFTDILFNTLMSFFMLFVLAVLMINPEAKNKDVELRAEILITMTCPDNSPDDIDLMVKLPNDQVVYYGRRDVKTANLDRDDRGTINDRIKMEDGSYHTIKGNWEHVTLRKLFPGEYIVNAYAFNNADNVPTEVKINVERLNPRYRAVFKSTMVLYEVGEELTFVRFTVDDNGRITSVDTTEESFRTYLKEGQL